MPRRRIRPAGIAWFWAACGLVGLVLAAACSSPLQSAMPPPMPSPAAPAPSAATAAGPARLAWVEDLSLSGDLNGRIVQVAPGDSATQSECTGRNSRPGGSWASTIYGQMGQDVWGVVVLVPNYRGAGSYAGGQASAQVHDPSSTRVWGVSGDPVTFTVASDQESGTLDAVLTNVSNGSSKLHVSGHWTCRT
jgi:hypothetical protein